MDHSPDLFPSARGEVYGRVARAVGGRLPPLDLEDGDGLDAVLDRDGRARAELAAGAFGFARRRVAQKYLAGPRVLLQARGEVDGVADGRVLGAALRADVADGRHARVQADADGELVDVFDLALHVHGGGDGVAGVVGRGGRRAEQRHQAVADVLVERAAVSEDDLGHRREVVV